MARSVITRAPSGWLCESSGRATPPAERAESYRCPQENQKRLEQQVAYGTTGQVVMSRLDLSCFLPNVMERDCAVRVPPSAAGMPDGIGDPRPRMIQSLNIDKGIY